VFHSAAHHKRVPRPYIERFSLAGNLQVAMDDVHDLIVRMAVHCPHPAFHHLVLGKKQFVVEGKHTALQPAFRRGLLAFLVCYHYEVGKSVCSRFHLLSLINPDCSDLCGRSLFVPLPEMRFPQRASQPPSTARTCPCT